jgi:hypothetical protein
MEVQIAAAAPFSPDFDTKHQRFFFGMAVVEVSTLLGV